MHKLNVLLIVHLVAGSAAAIASADSVAEEGRMCAQVVSCGIKDGKAKEYPTPCAAEDDGATQVEPKTGAVCPGPR